jgi:hypothetical protein
MVPAEAAREKAACTARTSLSSYLYDRSSPKDRTGKDKDSHNSFGEIEFHHGTRIVQQSTKVSGGREKATANIQLNRPVGYGVPSYISFCRTFSILGAS